MENSEGGKVIDFQVHRRSRRSISLATPCYYSRESNRYYEQSNSHDHRGSNVQNVFQRKPEKSMSRQFGLPLIARKEIKDTLPVRNIPRFFTKSLKRSRKFEQPSIETQDVIHSDDTQHQSIFVAKNDYHDQRRKSRKYFKPNCINVFKIVFFPSAIIIISIIFMLCVDFTIRPTPAANWSERKLDGRECVLNFFINKHAKDEYNPDFGSVLLDNKNWPPGKFEVISRFISSVAGTFRSKIHLKQHLIFTGIRDGGLLAEKAFQGWPRRGSLYSELHVVTADTDNDSLEYSLLGSIEERFKGKDNIRVYSREGIAGLRIDEDGNFIEKEKYISSFHKNLLNGTKNNLPYPDLQSFIQQSKGDVIPYLHVDGLRMADQFEILINAVPLFKSKTVSAVGIEHSPDMNILKLVKFFDSVEYKTFFLGSRRLARIDNLCPETLLDVLQYLLTNSLNTRWPDMFRKMLRFRVNHDISNEYQHPPFFVALPRGRLNQEEMAIQHTYDLFGGFDGEKEITTANDRLFKK